MHRAVCWIAVALASSSAAAQVAQPASAPTAGLERPATSFALDNEATALVGNPAGLAFTRGLTLEYLRNGGYGASVGGGDGLFLSAGAGPIAGGFATEWLHPGSRCSVATPCPRRTSWGLALRGGRVALGAAYHGFSSGDSRDYDTLSTWDVGVIARVFSWLSLGFVAQDVGEATFGSTRLPRRWNAAVGLRPVGEIADLGLDVRWRDCADATVPATPVPCGAAHSDWFVTLDARVVSGVRLIGQLGFIDRFDGPLTAQVGFQFDLPHAGVRFAPRFIENGSTRQATQVRVSTERWPSLSVPRARAAMIDLRKALERPKPDPLALVFPRSATDPLATTLQAFRRLQTDRAVKAVVLRSGGLPFGLAKAQELRSGIEGLQGAGKKVVYYLESGGDLEYSVAVSADRVYVAPQAILAVNGFSATALFAAAGLDKLGVKAEFFRVGAYKNAPDLFTRSDMSGEQREQVNALLDDLFGRYVREVSEKRHIDAQMFRRLLDKGLLKPQEAKDAGLVDGLLYPDQLEEEVGKLVGGKVAFERTRVDPEDVRDERWVGPPKIEVVRIEGNILRGEGGRDPFGVVRLAGSEPIARKIRRAADDRSVAAIVVRIDSPGGEGNASDLIWRELVRARKEKKKPVIASMGDVAASGGYYVAAGADEIWAEPDTITGSIGVFAGHFDAEELYGKLGLHLVTIKRGQSADLASTARGLTDPERAMLQSWVESFYDQFVGRVAESRNLSKAEVDRAGRGRVWSGSQALERKLVDHLGGLEEAIAAAKKRAGMGVDDDVEVEDRIDASVDLSDLAGVPTLTALPGLTERAIRALHLVGEPDTPRAILPFDLEVR